jgi:hypothetical protein
MDTRVVRRLLFVLVLGAAAVNNVHGRSANGDTTGSSLLGSPPSVVSVDPQLKRGIGSFRPTSYLAIRCSTTPAFG